MRIGLACLLTGLLPRDALLRRNLSWPLCRRPAAID
jgi:hypothetical protein